MPKLYHSFVSGKSDASDASLVRPSNWNDSLQYANSAGTGPSGTSATVRELLTANRTYYVRTDGSNSNTGLTDTSGGAFLSWEYAYNYICAYIDTGGYTVYIQHGNEGAGVKTFNEIITITQPWIGGGSIYFIGNSGDLATPSNLVIQATSGGADYSTFLFTNFVIPGPLYINGMTISNGSLSNGAMISNWCPGTIFIDKLIFKSGSVASYCHVGAVAPGAFIVAGTPESASATIEIVATATDAAYHAQVTTLASYQCAFGATVTLTGTPNFTNAFVDVEDLGYAVFTGCTFVSSATGKRYNVSGNGVIQTGGGGATFLPGSVAGTSATGGQYI